MWLHGHRLAGRRCSKMLLWSAGILQEAMAKGEYWRLIDSQGRPPGLLGMWPSRAVSFIENHDTGAYLPARSTAAAPCSLACTGTACPCLLSSATEALSAGALLADALSFETSLLGHLL